MKQRVKTYITETPVWYDDETKALKGTTTEDGSPWVSPPKSKLTLDQLHDWVILQHKKKVFKNVLGQGATKIALYNDGKTVFKFVSDTADFSLFGNQVAEENRMYAKWGKKYSNILAKIYKKGELWSIQERANPIKDSNFFKMTGVKLFIWETFFCGNEELLFVQWGKNLKLFLRLVPLLTANKDEQVWKILDILNKNEINRMRLETLRKVARSPALVSIIKLCLESGLNIQDLQGRNLGEVNGRLVIIDYGLAVS